MTTTKLFLILGLLACLTYGQQDCNPEIKWRNCPRRTRDNCDACINVRFNNAANDRDVLCLKRQGNACIYTGNFLNDRSFAAVTGKNGVCQPFSNDPLEVSLSSNKCSGGFQVENGKTKRPPPVFGPGVVDDVVVPPNRNPQGRPTFGDGIVDEVLEVPDSVRNPNRRPIALPNFQAGPIFQA